jgi:hypothetical protein
MECGQATDGGFTPPVALFVAKRHRPEGGLGVRRPRNAMSVLLLAADERCAVAG